MILKTVLLCLSIVVTSCYRSESNAHYRWNGQTYAGNEQNFAGNEQNFAGNRQNFAGNNQDEPKLSIVNGEAAGRREATFAVFIDIQYYNGTTKKGHMCTGTLINPSTVLTAAHCVYGRLDNSHISVRYGTHDETKPMYPDIEAKWVIPHPGFRPNLQYLFFDIALIRLQQPVQLDRRYVNIARLPERNWYWYLPGTHLTVYGWGLTHEQSQDSAPNKLQKTSMWITDEQPLDMRLSDYSIIGARNRRSAICKGDSGGPVVVEGNVLIGVISASYKKGGIDAFFCSPNVMALITKVESYLGWIEYNLMLLSGAL